MLRKHSLHIASLLAVVNIMQTGMTLNPTIALNTTHMPAPLPFAARLPKGKAQWKRERQGR